MSWKSQQFAASQLQTSWRSFLFSKTLRTIQLWHRIHGNLSVTQTTTDGKIIFKLLQIVYFSCPFVFLFAKVKFKYLVKKIQPILTLASIEVKYRAINLRKCSEHPEAALTVRHLEEAHPRAGGWKLSNLLISERKGNTEWKEDAVELILRLTGPPLFSRQTDWQTKPLNIISKCRLLCVVAWESTLNKPHLCLFWLIDWSEIQINNTISINVSHG